MPWNVRRWAYLIVPAAHKYHISPALIAAVMAVESGGDPLAWNAQSDARGLMQVLHGPWNPGPNVELGTSMLASFHAMFSSWTLTLAAYNAGPNAVIASGGVPPIAETQDYVVLVQYLFNLYARHPLTLVQRRVYQRALRQYRRLRPPLMHLTAQALATLGRRRFQTLIESNLSPPATPRLTCRAEPCTHTAARAIWTLEDPFWPLGGSLDPLPRVAPPSRPAHPHDPLPAYLRRK